MLLRDFIEAEGSRFPEEFINSLPQTCLDERCQAPTEISPTLTGLCCSNPRCPSKIAVRLVGMMKKIGVKDFGGKGKQCDKFITEFGVTNPLMIFAYNPDEDGALAEGISIDVSRKIFNQIDQKRSYTLAEYVKLANLPFIQTSATSIFGEYDKLEDAYRDIEEGGVEFIRSKLNIQKGSSTDDDLDYGEQPVSVRALKIYEVLIGFKQDLFFGIPFVNIIEVNRGDVKTLKVKCTEQVGQPFAKKSDFYATINARNANVHVDFVDSASKSLDYLVWAGADGSPANVSNKVVKVKKWNSEYKAKKEAGTLKANDKYIPIVTALEFLNIIDDM